jgi:hypothetical protein
MSPFIHQVVRMSVSHLSGIAADQARIGDKYGSQERRARGGPHKDFHKVLAPADSAVRQYCSSLTGESPVFGLKGCRPSTAKSFICGGEAVRTVVRRATLDPSMAQLSGAGRALHHGTRTTRVLLSRSSNARAASPRRTSGRVTSSYRVYRVTRTGVRSSPSISRKIRLSAWVSLAR